MPDMLGGRGVEEKLCKMQSALNKAVTSPELFFFF